MPYSGGDDRQRQPHNITADWTYVKKMPGILVVLQLFCSLLGFLLGMIGSIKWRVREGHGVFIFFSFMASLSCTCFLALRVYSIHTIFCRQAQMDWNKLGLVHSGINSFLMMVGSSMMLEVASGARMLRAAGVFGFLSFTMYLSQLVWEVLAWRKEHDGGLLPAFVTASVVQGRNDNQRSSSSSSPPASRVDIVRGEVALEDNHDQEGEAVGFVGMKQRPVSSFLPPSYSSVTSPMLYVPGWSEDDVKKDEGEGRGGEGEAGGKTQGGETKKRGETADDKLISVRSSGSSSSSSACNWQVPT